MAYSARSEAIKAALLLRAQSGKDGQHFGACPLASKDEPPTPDELRQHEKCALSAEILAEIGTGI